MGRRRELEGMSCESLSGFLSCPGILLQLAAMDMFFISPLGTRSLFVPAPLATVSWSARIIFTPLCKAITGCRLQMLPSRLDRHSPCLSWASLVSYHCLAGSILLTKVLSPAQLSWLKDCRMAAASSSLGTSSCGKCQESCMD